METYSNAAKQGAVAGVIGSVVQTGVGFALDQLLLPPRQHNNIAPRLVKRLSFFSGHRQNAVRDWILGTLFHIGYGLGWGVFLGLARRWSSMPPLPLGALTGGLIYLLAFSRRGVGTMTATEPPPSARGWRKEASLVAVAWAYAFATAFIDERLGHLGEPSQTGAPGGIRAL
jgi:hypothetical protein